LAISSRLPGRQQIIQVYAIIVLIIFSWTILWLFWKLPSWRIFLTAWEIVGVLAFSLSTALAESLVVLSALLILVLSLPRAWFGEVFVARGASLAATALGTMMFLDDQFKHEMLYPELPLGVWLLALPLAAIVLIPYAAGRIAWFRRIVESFADRATIFLYIMLPLSGISMFVVLVRALALTLSS